MSKVIDFTAPTFTEEDPTVVFNFKTMKNENLEKLLMAAVGATVTDTTGNAYGLGKTLVKYHESIRCGGKRKLTSFIVLDEKPATKIPVVKSVLGVVAITKKIDGKYVVTGIDQAFIEHLTETGKMQMAWKVIFSNCTFVEA